jgi:LssY C-terminus
LLCIAPTTAATCDSIPAGKSFWVRLLDPVASYSSKPGTTIRAVLIQSPECDESPVFPAGLEVNGHVVSVRSVGMGVKHDTAQVVLSFDSITTSSGAVLAISAEVAEVDNARETVSKGVIRGVNATDSPQGRITNRLGHLPTYDPYSTIPLMIYRTVAPLPEPEIYLPPSTDLRLRFLQPLFVGDQPELPRPDFQMNEDERADVESLTDNSSLRTETHSGKDADLVNLAFVGSSEQLHGAFAAAGWHPADRVSGNAVLREFHAMMMFTTYSTNPITRQYLDSRVQDLTWQKSFNSFAKREHIRVWQKPQTVLGQPAWLAAYSRETSATLSVRYHKFIHHIDGNLDEGVNMLVRDLTLSGCVDSVRLLPRPNVPQNMVNSTGDEMRTDGTLTVVHLKNCDRLPIETAGADQTIPSRPHSRVRRYFRNEILMYKSDVFRGNFIYGAFDLCRMSVHSFRQRHAESFQAVDNNLPSSPVSPDTLLPQTIVSGVPPLAGAS